jgi:hypothetical protein
LQGFSEKLLSFHHASGETEEMWCYSWRVVQLNKKPQLNFRWQKFLDQFGFCCKNTGSKFFIYMSGFNITSHIKTLTTAISFAEFDA